MTARLDRRALLGAAAALTLAGPGAAQAPADGLAGLARLAGISFGSAANSLRLADDPVYTRQLLADAQLLVPEWEAKWSAMQPRPGSFDLGPLAAIAQFAAANGRSLRGHVLLWHQDMPQWLIDAVFEGPARARGLLAAHLDSILPATRLAIRDWDVVNEAVADVEGNPFAPPPVAVGELRDTPWLRSLGPGYVDLAFRLARERDPTLRLTYNEYGIEGDSPWAEEKRRRTLRLLRRLVEARVPIDALGIQGHLIMDEGFRPEGFAPFLRAVRELGLAILITELDVREGARLAPDLAGRDAAVAERVRLFVGTALEGGCRTVLTWGLSDKDSWLVKDPDVARRDGQSHRGLPLDGEGQRKPMWQALARVFAARGRG